MPTIDPNATIDVQMALGKPELDLKLHTVIGLGRRDCPSHHSYRKMPNGRELEFNRTS